MPEQFQTLLYRTIFSSFGPALAKYNKQVFITQTRKKNSSMHYNAGKKDSNYYRPGGTGFYPTPL